MSIPRSFATALLLVATLSVHAQDAVGRGASDSQARSDLMLRLMVDKGLVPLDAATQTARQVKDVASDLVISALNFLGVTYRRGGESAEHGFDCSGFVRYIFQNSVGLVLPRRADEQAQASSVTPIDREELRPGDLVFFNTLRRAFSHVGIYIGDGKFIHSPRTGASVRVEDMGKDYWVQRFNGARRVVAIESAAAEAARTTSPR